MTCQSSIIVGEPSHKKVGKRALLGDLGMVGKQLPFLQLTWHLWRGTWKINVLLRGAPVSCHVRWMEGK